MRRRALLSLASLFVASQFNPRGSGIKCFHLIFLDFQLGKSKLENIWKPLTSLIIDLEFRFTTTIPRFQFIRG